MTKLASRNCGLAVVMLSAAALLVPAAHAQTLEDIINNSLEAAGGRAAIEAITSVRQSGTFTMGTGYGDLDGDIEVVTIPNQKVYQALESDLFEQFSGWNGVSGWQSDTAQGLIDLEGDQAASLAAQTALHPFIAYGRPEFGVTEFQKLDDADIGGRAHHVVRIGGAGLDFDIFVDAETWLVSRLQFDTMVPQMGEITITAETSGYEEHNGVMLASINSLVLPAVVTIDMQYTTTEIDVEVDHSIFEKP